MPSRPKQRKTRGERRAESTSPLRGIPWRPIKNYLAPVSPLDEDAENKIHGASMRILEEIGIAFLDKEVLDLWERAGARVDRTREQVWIDRGLLDELVSQAPAEFTWRARNPAHNLNIGGNRTFFCPMGGAVFINDLDRGRRPGMMADYVDILKLVQMSNALHVSGEQLIVPHDIPVSQRHLRRSLAGFTTADKVQMESAHGRLISGDALGMAKIVFGKGISDASGPVIGGVINASSPLRYDERMLGGLITFSAANQVTIITPFILAGAMSPITMAAAIAQQNAEALAGVALTQLVRAGAPVIYGGFATNVDLKSGTPAFGTPEGAWAAMAGAQMARRYKLPYRGSGSLTTSNLPDAQAAFETMWSMWPAVLAHTNFVMHAVGWLESGLTVSYEKMVIDMESLAMFQHFFKGVEISDETLAMDMIAAVKPGGHHLDTPHTYGRFKTEFYPSFVADRQNYGAWSESQVGDAAQRANKIWKQALREYQPPPIDSGIRVELEEYVNRRSGELEGVELYG